MTENLPAKTTTGTKLLGRLATKYGVEPEKLLGVLRDTAFKTGKDSDSFSDTELAAALILAEKYDLNPFIRQIYITRSRGVLLPIIPIDGWAKIVTSQPDYDGVEFKWDGEGDALCCTCKIYHKSRSRPTEIPEYLGECKQNTDPWKKWPRRMLRHKAYIQCARLAFALSDAIDDDEAARYVDVKAVESQPAAREMSLPTARHPDIVPETEAEYRGRHSQGPEHPETTEEVIGVEDPERAGMKKAFQELWKQHEAAGCEPASRFGVTDEAGETMTIEDLRVLMQIMSEGLGEVAT